LFEVIAIADRSMANAAHKSSCPVRSNHFISEDEIDVPPFKFFTDEDSDGPSWYSTFIDGSRIRGSSTWAERQANSSGRAAIQLLMKKGYQYDHWYCFQQ